MLLTRFFLASLMGCWFFNTLAQPADDLVGLVNPLMGTDSKFSLSYGNTYPAIALPWGMNFWSPQTAPNGDGWMYAYDAETLRGFKQTHQPSPWINDYAAFSLMPVTGKLAFREEDRQAFFSHKAETSRPDYYAVYLSNFDVEVELTPTERAAHFRLTYSATDSAFLVVDAYAGGSQVKILPDKQQIIGYCRNHHGGVPENFHNYFVLQFDQPFAATHTWQDSVLYPDSREREGEHVGAVIGFAAQNGAVVHVRVASSFISPEQAQLNLQREIGTDEFGTTRQKAQAAWQKELSRFQVKGGSQGERETFYSCLYRSLLFPRRFYEFDADSQMVHYSPYNGEVRPGYLFTDNGFWDTFRAVFPFFTLMYPELNGQIMQGLVHTYEESGWLPEWASPGHRDCMIGSNSASLIADSYLKGIRGYDIEALYEALVKNTGGKGPVNSVGRWGAEHYNRLGYVPYDVGINENAARTLEYAYADFCLWKLAEALDKPGEEVALWQQRAQNYRHLFSPEHKLMRGRLENGQFQLPFNPFKWGDAFTEGNSWHYSWSVFHDVQGLIKLMGGRALFGQMLDSVFAMPPVYDESYYGFVIHEIREMELMNLGQYAHGNQPVQHMIYLYNYAGQPWKAQYWLRRVMQQLYAPTPDGYCGDEDNGQTSAWYVFSALGFYPVCPGSNQYVLGSPLFEEVELKLENGHRFTVRAPGNGPDTPYIQRAWLNGQPFDRTWLSHKEIMRGGELRLEMGPEPQKAWASDSEAAPYSMSEE